MSLLSFLFRFCACFLFFPLSFLDPSSGERKGINVPDSDLGLPALTDKDKEDALVSLEEDVEFVALSFVQNAQDVIQVSRVRAKLPRPRNGWKEGSKQGK